MELKKEKQVLQYGLAHIWEEIRHGYPVSSLFTVIGKTLSSRLQDKENSDGLVMVAQVQVSFYDTCLER